MSDSIGREVRFVLPDDAAVPTSINSGVPTVLFDARCRFAKNVKALVDTLVGPSATPFEEPAGEAGRERRLRLPGLTR
jgi:MinD-like ATPase involved in chromosome partitioning or flagellar assembly